MTIILDDENNLAAALEFDYKEVLNNAIITALSVENFLDNVEISVSFVDEEEIRQINNETRNIDKSTDVLSFPMIDYKEGGGYENILPDSLSTNPDNDNVLLGDIVLCIPKVLSQAEEFGHSVKREYAFLIVHSMLHLMGYDHMEAEERQVMENRQSIIMEQLKITREEML